MTNPCQFFPDFAANDVTKTNIRVLSGKIIRISDFWTGYPTDLPLTSIETPSFKFNFHELISKWFRKKRFGDYLVTTYLENLRIHAGCYIFCNFLKITIENGRN